jgi:hypothetical protein
MFESESYFGYLLAQIMFAFCLAMVEGGKAAWEVELWMADPTLSFTGVAVGHNVASTLFGGTMPLVATYLFYRESHLIQSENDLWPRLLPGFYVSILGCLSLFCMTWVTKHPHDVRTGDAKLRAAVERENQKFKAAQTKKQKRRKQLEQQLTSGNIPDSQYIPPFV